MLQEPSDDPVPSERSSKTAKYLSLAAVALALWTAFAPYPYPVVVALCAAAPWGAVLIARLRRDLRLLDLPGEAGLALVWTAPTAALFWRLFDRHIDGPFGLIALGVFMGVILLVAQLRTDPRDHGTNALFVTAALAALWGWGALVQIDAALAMKRPQVVKGVFLNVHDRTLIRVNRHPITETVMDVALPQERMYNIPLPRNYEIPKRPGDPVCIEIHSGFVGARYVYPVNCPLF